jgi:hypothetical protein
MADIAASGVTFLTAAHDPGTANTESGSMVEYWDILGDATGVTAPITPRYVKRPVAGSAGAASYAVSSGVITFTFASAPAAVHILARIIGQS